MSADTSATDAAPGALGEDLSALSWVRERNAVTEAELAAILDLKARLEAMGPDMRDGDEIQNMVFDVGKTHQFENLRDWFKCLYETLLGSPQGPRMGSFIALYGVENTRKLIAEALDD